LNQFIAQGLIILILINSILSSNVIEDGFPIPENNSNNFATNAESRDEEGQTPRQDLAEEGKPPDIGTSRSIEADHKNPSLLGNNSYNALPVPNFLNYYNNQTNKQIKGIVCLEISQESNKPENMIKIPCANIFIFIPNNNFTTNYNITNSPFNSHFVYRDILSYQLELLPKLISELYSKNKDYNCGIIKEYLSFNTEIISCTNIGILMR
jgi:hypothetical protein